MRLENLILCSWIWGTKSNARTIQVNTIIPESYPWTGVYLGGITITLEAKPDEGSSFSHCSTPELRQDSQIERDPMDDVEIEAIFE